MRKTGPRKSQTNKISRKVKRQSKSKIKLNLPRKNKRVGKIGKILTSVMLRMWRKWKKIRIKS